MNRKRAQLVARTEAKWARVIARGRRPRRARVAHLERYHRRRSGTPTGASSFTAIRLHDGRPMPAEGGSVRRPGDWAASKNLIRAYQDTP